MKANAKLSYLAHVYNRQHTGPKSSGAPSGSFSVRYTCPMHSEIVLDAPGRCPKCGMTLTPIVDAAQHATENIRVMSAAVCSLQPGSYLECGITRVQVSGSMALPNCVPTAGGAC